VEWDTLLFFFGIILCVQGLGLMGYLSLTSELFYSQLGPMVANISVGLLSDVVDNTPVMFAVLSMGPNMSLGQWLLVTLTAGVGSAAGVALVGKTQGLYTFLRHLKWMPVIAVGYAVSIATHIWLNSAIF
jgi:Na+/H+ antiporter NhaD/arsenite permease-like protein